MNPSAFLLSLLSGSTAALGASILFLMLLIPVRIFGVFSVHSMYLAGWSMACGLIGGALFSFEAAAFPLGPISGCLSMLFSGMTVGMLSSSLAEIVELIPSLADRLSLSASLNCLCWALSLGKTLGAFIASLHSLW